MELNIRKIVELCTGVLTLLPELKNDGIVFDADIEKIRGCLGTIKEEYSNRNFGIAKRKIEDVKSQFAIFRKPFSKTPEEKIYNSIKKKIDDLDFEIKSMTMRS